MSNLSGHKQITAAAVRELGQEWSANPIAKGLSAAALPGAVIARDLIDVLSLGHWADSGQKHHFMRKFDSQSPYQAYESAVAWIRSNALESAQTLAKRLAQQGAKGAPVDGQKLFAGVSWQPLGNAAHALEDSFAAGHAVRGAPLGGGSPGPIRHVKRYAGAEKHNHAEGDSEWKDAKGNFSADGRFAIDAVKALLRMVLTTAQSNANPQALAGWQAFQENWLKADAALSRATDRVFELIDRYTTGARIGATNVKTLNMDEAGLAKALLAENPQTVLAVFVRLDEQYNSDADDVAEIYVNTVKAQGGAGAAGLKSNKDLVTRLIKVMKEGWTSSGENKAIAYLKTLP